MEACVRYDSKLGAWSIRLYASSPSNLLDANFQEPSTTSTPAEADLVAPAEAAPLSSKASPRTWSGAKDGGGEGWEAKTENLD